MPDPEAVKSQIRAAFAKVDFPGDRYLRGSNEGDEPFLLEQAFKGKSDWRLLDPAFIDRAPDGFGTALHFFSDEAFRFYLPAYLIADIDGHLDQHDPVFHLTYGLSDEGKRERVNPRRYGERTWFDENAHKFAVFDREQARAIVSYLKFKRDANECHHNAVDQALANYWAGRAAGSEG
jgi:hypothetical protein